MHRAVVICSCLFVLGGGCFYNDEPIAQIVESPGRVSSGLVRPKVVEIDAGS